MTGTKTTSGFTMLWATEEMVNEHPISADTSAINDIESGAVCTMRARNPAFFEAVSRDSRRIEPGSAGSVTQFSDSNSINRTESLDANGWSLDMATRKFSSAINLDVIPSGGTVHRTIPMSSRRSSSINNASFAKAELSSTNSIPGLVFLTNFAHRPTSRCEEVPAKPRRTRPVVPLPAAETAISAIRHASRISRAGSSSASPAAVSRTVRVLRSNNGEPSCFSNCLIVRLSGGCAIRSRCAARPKCSSSATARNALI